MATGKFKRICVTDLDGTLLNDDHTISEPNLQALQKLGELDICRVAATGRSLYSLRKVITPENPFDYIIFSTGAGIMNWQMQKLILTRHIDKSLVAPAFKKLYKLHVDFMYHAPIPDNHRFIAIRGKGLADFERRIGFYREFCESWSEHDRLPWEEGTQFLVIADKEEEALFPALINLLQPLRVIRTTSPLDHASLWFEVFEPEVSKGSAVEYLQELMGLTTDDLMVVGNDYNDIDMLKLTRWAFVTSNGPSELKKHYRVVSGHNQHGFAEAVETWLQSL